MENRKTDHGEDRHAIGEKEDFTMKKLFDYADRYIQESSWKDIALLKFCLFAMGILAGMQMPEKNRKRVGIAAALVFAVTYIPLMSKYIRIVMGDSDKSCL